jgi:hypothetical protein
MLPSETQLLVLAASVDPWAIPCCSTEAPQPSTWTWRQPTPQSRAAIGTNVPLTWPFAVGERWRRMGVYEFLADFLRIFADQDQSFQRRAGAYRPPVTTRRQVREPHGAESSQPQIERPRRRRHASPSPSGAVTTAWQPNDSVRVPLNPSSRRTSSPRRPRRRRRSASLTKAAARRTDTPWSKCPQASLPRLGMTAAADRRADLAHDVDLPCTDLHRVFSISLGIDR